MASLQSYKKELSYSYALGIFSAMEALLKRPEKCTRLLVHSKGEESQGIKKLRVLCEDKGIRIEIADRALARISTKENHYCAMVFNKFEDILQEKENHLILHQLSDGGNIGTLLRTALGFNYKNIAFISPCADIFDPQGIRASMGAVFSQKIQLFENFEKYKEQFVSHSYYPFMLNGSKTIDEIINNGFAKPYGLILGNEGKGLPASFSHIGNPVRIAHSDEIDSLNVAVAGAIGMYAFSSKEGKENKNG